MEQLNDSLIERFSQIDAWVFDLDDTLYRQASGMGQQIRDGIRGFLADYFDVDVAEAVQIQRRLCDRYGTTLQGMIAEHGVAAKDFLAFENDLNYDVLAPDPVLAQAMTMLPGRLFVFTNASRAHAERVLRRIGLGAHFEDIYDILTADLVPKPLAPTYRKFVERTGVDPHRTVMFEDRAVNLVEAQVLGMATVLVGSPAAPVAELAEQDSGYDYATDDLAAFLRRVVETG